MLFTHEGSPGREEGGTAVTEDQDDEAERREGLLEAEEGVCCNWNRKKGAPARGRKQPHGDLGKCALLGMQIRSIYPTVPSTSLETRARTAFCTNAF